MDGDSKSQYVGIVVVVLLSILFVGLILLLVWFMASNIYTRNTRDRVKRRWFYGRRKDRRHCRCNRRRCVCYRFSNQAKTQLVSFLNENKKFDEALKSKININYSRMEQVYSDFIKNPTSATPVVVVEKAQEIYDFLVSGGTFSNYSNDTAKLSDYITNMVILLTDIINFKFLSMETVGGTNKEDKKIVDDYVNSGLTGLESYMDDYVANQTSADLEDIKEDARQNLAMEDTDPIRYAESLEDRIEFNKSAKSLAKSYSEAGRKLRRPYLGVNDSKVVVDTDPVYHADDNSKDYRFPAPGLLTGKTRDIETHGTRYYGRKILAGNIHNGFN